MEDFDHFSQIRVGNKVVYNGVNGDAFSFGEKPSVRSRNNTSKKKDVVSPGRGTEETPCRSWPDPHVMSVKQTSEMIATNTAPPILAASASSFPVKADDCDSNVSSGQPSETDEHSLCLQLKKSLEQQSRMISAPAAAPLTPASVGLPSILPLPPAAHIPPPLPSRPPSATPSRSSSLSSLFSIRHDDRSRGTPTPPEVSLAEDKAHDDDAHHNPYHLPNFIFRSSGTIKVQAPSRDLSHSSAHQPGSPPPLPMPVANTSASTSSSSSHTVAISCSKTFTESHHLDVSSPGKLITSLSASALSLKATSSTTSRTASDEEDTDLIDNKDLVDNKEDNKLSVDLRLTSHTPISQTATRAETSVVEEEQVLEKKKTKAACETSHGNRNIIPPEFTSIRKRPMSYGDLISSALVFYKFSTAGKKKLTYVQPKPEKAVQCRKCGRQFGFRCSRYHCTRCKKSFCDSCIPVMRVEADEHEGRTSSLTRVCGLCSEEIAYESSRGAYKGLWTDFQKMREEARAKRGLDVISLNIHKTLESQTMLDVTPGLRSLCLRFLVDLHHQAEKQSRNKFLANYLHFENSTQNRLKGKVIKNKECDACRRQLRMLTEIRECSICEQIFCINCVYPALQLYLPSGTNLKENIHLEAIKFYVKEDEQDEAEHSAATETYHVCNECEDIITRNLRIYEFNHKIPELEAEMFDLQRQIDHALTYEPHVHGMQRSASAHNLSHMSENESMATNIKLANRLYDRYMRGYDTLDHMQPQTSGQKTLHKHIKQAMYDFYLKRRSQLKSTLRRRDSWTNDGAETSKQ